MKKNKKSKKIIITGGLGHIGSYLVENLLKKYKNIHLIIIDSLYSKRYCSLFNLNNNNGNKLSFYDIDLRKLKEHDKLLKGTSIIIHMAAMAEPESSVKNHKEFRNNNLDCTKKIINFAKKNNSLFIFPSSASVYGSQISDDIISEKDFDKILPQSPYAKIKIEEEKLIQKKLNKKKFIILRLGTIVGISKGIRFNTAVNKFCYQASLNKKISVWKNSYLQIRPYTSLADVFKSILIFMKKKQTNDIYNVVTKNLSVKNIIDCIKERKKIKIQFVSSKIMNSMSYSVSNNKIRKLGFVPEKNIKKLIFKTLNLFNIDNNN